jgi:hypothetical protein
VGAQDVSNLPGPKTRRFQRVSALLTYSAHFDLTFRHFFLCHEGSYGAFVCNWTGTSDFQQNAQFFPARVSATIRQPDRNVEGTLLFTEPSWSGWQATFTGTMQMSGVTRSNTLRWESPILSLRPTGTNAGGTVCLGDVLTIIWILGR